MAALLAMLRTLQDRAVQTLDQALRLYAQARAATAFQWARLVRVSGPLRATAKAWAKQAYRLARFAFFHSLRAVENTLLSPVGRERVHATATFTLIFAFAITSVDFLIAGGPEFSPGAQARPYVAHTQLIGATSRRAEDAASVATDLADEDAVSAPPAEVAVVTPTSASSPQNSDLVAGAEPPKAERVVAVSEISAPTTGKVKPATTPSSLALLLRVHPLPTLRNGRFAPPFSGLERAENAGKPSYST